LFCIAPETRLASSKAQQIRAATAAPRASD
jgi:hypothetical protein